jgi:DnaJ-class molecular chaperone
MSSGTTAARAATSRQVKQELVRLLFGKQYSRTGPEGHRLLDYSVHSYTDLKTAYLGRLQEIHPDKNKINNNNPFNGDSKKGFHELQNAWDKYEEMARAMKTMSEEGDEANFTMFGVGCSFSDNEQEKTLRNEIMEQACRGWFSSGLIADTSSNDTSSDESSKLKLKPVSLIHDDDFEEMTEESSLQPSNTEQKDIGKRKRPRTLIPGLKI